MTDQPERFNLNSHDIAGDKLQELLTLFPEIRTEGGKIDFERLKLALGETVDEGKERYGMNWPGKADCFKTIQQPSMGTLLPCPEESVNFDTTENLIIEGDNLEVLKLLQKSYLGKVKLIYIDPPYNTGNDFIYPDNYTESLQTYLEYTGQVDAEGKKFGTNTDTDGRFHSKWMNMMYPRLYLARNLLGEDGLIFISIDDKELRNLRAIVDDIFGEDNFVGQIINKSNPRGSQESVGISTEHEYILCYAKSEEGFYSILGHERDTEDEEFSFLTKDGRKARLLGLRKRGGDWRRSDRPNMFYAFYVNPTSCEVALSKEPGYTEVVYPARPAGEESRWTWGKETATKRMAELIAKKVTRGNKTVFDIYRIDPLHNESGERKREKLKSVWDDKELNYQHARQYFKEFFGDSEMFDFPKPPELVKKLLSALDTNSCMVLDYFAGSGTTSQSVLELNQQDGGNRKFILVQLPEPCGEESSAFKAGFKTIAEICKERVRRVIKKLNEADAGKLALKDGQKQDRGFRVFKLAESNFKPWNAQVSHDAAGLEKQLELHIAHIREDRSPDDILYEILLKSGFPLATSVEKVALASKMVHSVADGALFICLEHEVTLPLIRAMAEKKPQRVVCLDEGFAGNDQLKANAVQIFKTKGITSFKTV